MKYTDLKNYYLCGIGAFHGIESFHVARYDKERDCFYFSNGDLGSTVLHSEPRGSNATYVMSAISLAEIDDAELLYKYKDNV